MTMFVTAGEMAEFALGLKIHLAAAANANNGGDASVFANPDFANTISFGGTPA